MITVTLRGEAAEKLRAALGNPKRIDWTGFSRMIEKEKRA